MNFLLAVVTTGLVVAVYGISASPVLSQDRKVLLYKHHQACQAKTGVDNHHFSHIEDVLKSEDAKLKEYLLCFLQKLGFMNELGELHQEMIRKKLMDLHEDHSNVEVVVKECVVRRDQPMESAFGFYKCYQRHYPQQGFLSQVIHISDEIHNKLRAHYSHCSTESGVAREILDRACQGDFAEDAALRIFWHCFAKRVGFQNEEGQILEKVVREKLREMVLDEDQSNILIEKCLRERGTPEQTAFEFMRCFVRNTHSDVWRNPISKEREQLAQIHSKCRKESSIEDTLIEKFKRGEFHDHPQGKKHLFCVYKNTGHIDELGEFNHEKVRERLVQQYSDPSTIERYINKCLVKKGSPEETAYYVHTCFYENTPDKFNVFSVL
ncbi:unnamed protein product [Phaedon cochleariae]|uniref:Uncharacterized protein n=1 Tax=Phaedon cochleariae TaxID=80249 RepID=A0A9P0GRK6_PHACE|nr:unnamed protein product [Phaedon cochleariae]